MFRIRIIVSLMFLMVCSLPAFAQAAKGVDKQNERVRDSGSDRTPGNNGNKTDTGAGRGMDFGRGRTPEAPPLPNPYRLSGRRDVIIAAVQDLMHDRKMVLDEVASKLSDGIIVSQPFTFTKGAVTSAGELSRYADVPIPRGGRGRGGGTRWPVEFSRTMGRPGTVGLMQRARGGRKGATGVGGARSGGTAR